MPYEGEFATYRSIRRLNESERVKELLGRMKINDLSQDEATLPTIKISDARPSKWQPNFVLAVDGSYQEVPIKNGYPGAEIGYVTVAAVLMNFKKIRELDFQRPANPKLFRKTEDIGSIDWVFPGCNMIIDEQSPKHSLRKVLFEMLEKERLEEDSESFLDTYEALLEHKPEDPKPDCPYAESESCLATDKKYLRGTGTYSCECSNANELYSTDALRIHERMRPDNSNGEIFGEIMQVLEFIAVIHILRYFEKTNLLWVLKNMGIVIDGPLRVFGQPAWLSAAIRHELNRINKIAKPYTDGQDLLMIGVEKSGLFVDHFERIDRNDLPSQVAYLLTDEYIKKHIIFSNSSKPYGASTYFGRKFFYKTASGARIVASLPFLDESHLQTTRAERDQYPRLTDALGLLDQAVSSRYPNSLSPLISAHAEAAIPMNLGSQNLGNLAKKIMEEGQQ